MPESLRNRLKSIYRKMLIHFFVLGWGGRLDSEEGFLCTYYVVVEIDTKKRGHVSPLSPHGAPKLLSVLAEELS